MFKADGRINTRSLMITCYKFSSILAKKGKIEFCLIFDDFRTDVITSVIDLNFLHF